MLTDLTNTGIVEISYNSRGLITHRASTYNLVRETNGTLWAAVREATSLLTIHLHKSTDGGFTWHELWIGSLSGGNKISGVAGLPQNGPFISLQIWEARNEAVIWHAFFNTSTNSYDVEPIVINTISGDQTIYVANEPTGMPPKNEIVLDADFMAIKSVYTELGSFVVYVSHNNLKLKGYYPKFYINTMSTATLNGRFFNIFDAVANPYNEVAVAIVSDLGSHWQILHTIYTPQAAVFVPPSIVYDNQVKTNIITDLCIRRNGLGHFVVAWGEVVGSVSHVKWSYSTDGGAVWSPAETVPVSSGHGSFMDIPTGELSPRVVLTAGLKDFMIGYTREVDGIGKGFVRQIWQEDDEVTYTLQEERQIATQEDQSLEIAGFKFFEPTGTRMMDISDPSVVRIGYQVEQGNSTTQNDTFPVRFGQELLKDSAFPQWSNSLDGSYEIDTVTDNQLLGTVFVMAGAADHYDYYFMGARGKTTDRFLASFNRVGLETRIKRYDPNPESYMNDETAYIEPEEFISMTVITPMSYEFPFPQSSESVSQYIERDARKVYIPPDFWMGRQFILNKGNFLKRTVWTLLYDGNEYEISQVVPYLIKGQICQYTANAYVIGPSNNPFSRKVLPSET